jgi:hypothetical protein
MIENDPKGFRRKKIRPAIGGRITEFLVIALLVAVLIVILSSVF